MIHRDGTGHPDGHRSGHCREGLEELGIGGEFLRIRRGDLCGDKGGIRCLGDHSGRRGRDDRHDIPARDDGRLNRGPGRGDDSSPRSPVRSPDAGVGVAVAGGLDGGDGAQPYPRSVGRDALHLG